MKHKHADVTEWFPAHIKPARPGVYQQMCGLGKDLGYQHFDGNGWGGWFSTPESAERFARKHDAGCTEWRGLAASPYPADEQTDNHTGICLEEQA